MSTNNPFSNTKAPGVGLPTNPSTNRFGNPISPGSGTSGMSDGLHGAVFDYVQGSEFGGVLTDQWGLYTPSYLGIGQKLPAQASSGQISYCLVDASESIVWQFCYFGAGDQGQIQGQGFTGFPWIFVGGAPMRSYIETNESTSAGSWADLATVGPQITAPFSGDYDVTFGAALNAGTLANEFAFMGISVGGATPTLPWVRAQLPGSGNINISVASQVRLIGVIAGQTLTAKYQMGAGGGTMSFTERFMVVTPIRLAGV